MTAIRLIMNLEIVAYTPVSHFRCFYTLDIFMLAGTCMPSLLIFKMIELNSPFVISC